MSYFYLKGLQVPPTVLPTQKVEKSNFSPKLLEFVGDIGIIFIDVQS